MVLKGVIWVNNTKNQVIWSWKESIWYTMIKLGQMVLKGANWVHNDKIGSNGLKMSQLGTKYKYRGYLLKQVVLPNKVAPIFVVCTQLVFFFTEKFVDFSVWCCPVEGWVGNVVLAISKLKSAEHCGFHQKLQFLDQNLQFSSKTVDFHQKTLFQQNPWFSLKSMVSVKSSVASKTAVFIKNCRFSSKTVDFHQNPWFSWKSMVFGIFLWAFKRITSNRDSMWNERLLA